MDWTVVAAFVGVLVPAALTALGIAREQSALRQLERVAAVLKDTADDVPGRPHLVWLHAALAERVNAQYRAPRYRPLQVLAWTMVLGGWSLAIYLYVIVLVAFVRATPSDPHLPAIVGMGIFGGLLVSFLVAVFLGRRWLRQRATRRFEWLATAAPEDSAAPRL
jgi:uncharacterized membrane protein (DUF485 family)